jgi:cell division protease FtsH
MMTKALLEWETIDAEQINDIMAGREPTPPKSVQLTKRPPAATAAAWRPNVTAPA